MTQPNYSIGIISFNFYAQNKICITKIFHIKHRTKLGFDILNDYIVFYNQHHIIKRQDLINKSSEPTCLAYTHSEKLCFLRNWFSIYKYQNLYTKFLVIVLIHTWTSSTCKPTPSFPLLQNSVVVSCRFIFPNHHVEMLSSHPSTLFQDHNKH